ncbi:MAG: hypothetical protein AAGI07_01480 [Bacteroidota bacterium]
MNFKQKKKLQWLTIILLLATSLAFQQVSITKKVIYEEIDGKIAVEAEHFAKQYKTKKRKWYLQDANNTANVAPDADENHFIDASGGAYLELLPDTRVTHDDPLVHGESFSNKPGVMAILDYKVYFNSPGKYYVWVRVHTSGTEDNGIHVGINGTWPESGQRMQFSGNSKKWIWESRQRTKEVHTGVEKLIYLEIPEAGLHTISFSMREDGFEFDKWMMEKEYKRPEGKGIAERIKKHRMN